jgi:hypothetical protein
MNDSTPMTETHSLHVNVKSHNPNEVRQLLVELGAWVDKKIEEGFKDFAFDWSHLEQSSVALMAKKSKD